MIKETNRAACRTLNNRKNKRQQEYQTLTKRLMLLLFYYVHKIAGFAAKFREKAKKRKLRIIDVLS